MDDELDRLIDGAFVAFVAGERGTSQPAPGPQRVRRTVAHRRRVRYVVLSAAVAGIVAVPVAVYAMVPHRADPPPVVVGSTDGSATAAVTTSPPKRADVRNSTLTLTDPQFPEQCGGAGTRTFVNGVAKISDNVTWTIGEPAPIEADLDGIPGDEVVTTLWCDNSPGRVSQLLAIKVGADGRLTPLGYINRAADGGILEFDPSTITVTGGVVQLTTSGPMSLENPTCFRQVRGYAYRNGRFTQVSGPTSFPDPPYDIHDVDLRETGLFVAVPVPVGYANVCAPMHQGTGTADVDPEGDRVGPKEPYTFMVGQGVSFVAGEFRDFAVTQVTLRSASGLSRQTVQAFWRTPGGVLGEMVQATGVDGVTAIHGVTTSAGRIKVIVTADGRQQEWQYEQAPGETWKRVN